MKVIFLAAFKTFTPEMSVSDISGDMTPVLSTNRSPYFICRVILCSLFNLEGESSAAVMTVHIIKLFLHPAGQKVVSNVKDLKHFCCIL